MSGFMVPKKLVWIVVSAVVGLIATAVIALVIEVWSASAAREINAIQMDNLIAAVATVGDNLDAAIESGNADRNVLRTRIATLEQFAARATGDIEGILRALDEAKLRLAALERGDLGPIRIPIGGGP